MSAGFQIIVPIVSPYAADGSLDAGALSRHAAVLAGRGADGFFVAGTNGEGPLLTDDEVIAAVVAVRSGAPQTRIIAQVGRNGTDETRELLVRARDAGADAVAAVTPYYYALEADQALEHYGTLIRASGDMPLYAYVIPSYAGNDITPDVARELAALGVAGIKDSTKSLERHRAYVAIAQAGMAPRGFDTFVGDDALTLAALNMGSSGAVPALANVRPDLFADLVGAAERADHAAAGRAQERVAELRAAVRGQGISTLKHAVAALMAGHGVDYGFTVRAPLRQHGSSS